MAMRYPRLPPATDRTYPLELSNHKGTFLSQCETLRRNDPSFLTVISERAIDGYGLSLGTALESNTVVTHVCLNPSNFSATSDLNDTEPMVRYLASSVALSKVTLETAGASDVDHQLTGRLLVATGRNPRIETVDLKVEVPAADFCSFLDSTSAKGLLLKDSRAFRQWNDASDSVQIVNAFGSNQSLEELYLNSNESSSDLVEKVLRRLGSHPSLLKLSLQTYEASFSAALCGLPALLRSTPRLHTLDIEYPSIDLDTWKELLEALQVNTTVSSFTLVNWMFEDTAAPEFFDFIRNKANRGVNVLRRLRLNCMGSLQTLVESMLAHSALEVLELEAYNNINAAKEFFEGLQANAATIRLQEIRFETNAEVARGFMAFTRFII